MYAGRRPDKVDPRDTRVASWTHCHLSGEPLTPPCVVDLLGSVFNKEAVVRALVDKSIPVALKHIKGLRDVVGIQLTEIPGLDKKAHVRFLCPITQQEFSGSFKSVALRPCGHVLSARALKELPSPTCLVCHAKFLESDRIPINGTEEEVEALRTRMEEEQASRRAGKKKKAAPVSQVDVVATGNEPKGAVLEDVDGVAVVDVRARSLEKKSIAAGVAAACSQSPDDKAIAAGGLVDKHGVKRKAAEGPTAGMKNASEVSANKARPKGSDLVQVKQHFKAVDRLPTGASKDVYASIFTSSRKEDLKETYSCRSLPLGRN
ncbi:unnamed protein product [Closterium sp. Naga37s-1]|nr:unnamed protein product [Closterium sp. Naga37s-1]